VVKPIDKSLKAEIHVYTRSDACGAAETWAAFLGKKQEDLLGVGVYGDPGLAQAVQKDISGIGYNNINYAYDAATKLPVKGIKVVPVDINGNGLLDGEENFYATSNDIVKAIATGKYPSPPARNLHFVSQGIPEGKEVREFISWVLTEGQRFVTEAGYINLTREKRQEELKKLAK
jgi:phosphate transport system substrate-binding protein